MRLNFTLLLFGSVVLVILGAGGSYAYSTYTEIVDTEEALPIDMLPPAPKVDTLSLLFVGDIMGHGPQIKAAQIVKNETYDFLPNYYYVQDIIQDADLAIGNLEVTLPGKPPYQGYPQFRSPDDLARALRLSGFDVMVTANNHSNDAGKVGVINTIETLKSWGFYQTGTFKSQAERDAFYPLIIRKEGFRIALLNYTYGTNGLPTRAPTVVNMIDTALIRADLAKATALAPDFTIVVMHWGAEYQLDESQRQRRIADYALKSGADMIIGAHPHVIQPIKERPVPRPDGSVDTAIVVYSLGNFISNQKKENTDGGLIFEVDLLKDDTDSVYVGDHSYIPVWRYREQDERGTTFRILPVSRFEVNGRDSLDMPVADFKAMRSFGRRMRRHLDRFASVERRLGPRPTNSPSDTTAVSSR